MKLSKIVLMCVCCFCVTLSVSAGADNNILVWQIGQKDADFAEFALAGTGGNKQYLARFGQDVNFTVGKDDPSQGWSYVHPGPSDAWAGSREHPFTILFNLAEKKYKAYVFKIHLTSSHPGVPPELSVQINNITRQIETSPGPGDHALTDPKAGGAANTFDHFSG